MRHWKQTLLAALTLSVSSLVSAATPPNILVIVADDLGYADIGVQGVAKDVRTPNIDSIANDGVRFTNAYVSCPVCSPSRAGFLTGRYQERFGHEHNPAMSFDRNKFGLPTDQVTFADYLKKSGYTTGIVGKWHEGSSPQFLPTHRGFDEFYGFLGGAHTYTAIGKDVNALRRNETILTEEPDYLTDAISREAVSFVQRHHDKPFFLYVAYNAVHTPQQAPPKYQQRFADVKDQPRKMMLAMLSAEDDGVGQILAKLKEHHLDDNTLVVFFSDNGGPTPSNASSNAPFRGYKGQVFEGGIRIPFMMRWPGQIPAGKTVDAPVISLDLLPTALAAAGAQPAPNLDGVNLLPLVQGKSGEARPHDTLYWRYSPQWAIRDGDHKLLHTREGNTHLYDLKNDPGEKTDLAQDKPELAKQLQEKYDAWNAQLPHPLWPGRQEGANAKNKSDDE